MIILVVYLRVAAACLDVPVHPRVLAMLLPVIAGVVPCLAIEGSRGCGGRRRAAVVVTALLVVVARPFSSDDADLISRLDMPGPLKRLVLRLVSDARRRALRPEAERAEYGRTW